MDNYNQRRLSHPNTDSRLTYERFIWQVSGHNRHAVRSLQGDNAIFWQAFFKHVIATHFARARPEHKLWAVDTIPKVSAVAEV